MMQMLGVTKGYHLVYGKFERAIECFETAIWIDASNAPAWYNKGLTLKGNPL